MVASNMEGRQLRKRRWKSSPNKTARAELDFGQKTPSPKKRRLDENKNLDVNDDEQESFTIKSFYGKREKIHFPHSPGRRKKVGEVLDKLVDDSTESESDKKPRNKRSTYQFSSDSAETDSDYKPKVKSGSAKKSASKKMPLDVKVKRKELRTPEMNAKNKRFLSNSTSKLADRPVLTEREPQLQTPISGKKFFKTRSPASADKCIAGIVVGKGFNLQFVPNKKLKASKTPKSNDNKKSKTKTEKASTPKGVTVKSLRRTITVEHAEEGVFYLDNNDNKNEAKENLKEAISGTVIDSVKKDMEVNHNKEADEIIDSVDINKNEEETEISGGYTDSITNKELSDSAIDTANSEDLFSNVSDHSGPVVRERQIDNGESSDQSRDLQNDETNLSENSGPVFRKRSGDEAESDLESGMLESGQTTPSRGNPSTSVSPQSGSSSVIGGSQSSPQSGKKLFPIFTKGMRTPQSSKKDSLRKLRSCNSPGGSPLLRYVKSKETKEQMIIWAKAQDKIMDNLQSDKKNEKLENTGVDSSEMDAGQKKYGVTHCGVCGMIYSQAEPADETMHHNFHRGLLNALRFPGWKKEHVVQEFLDTGSRIIMVTAGDPTYATKKVEEINNIMGRELGFPEQTLVFSQKYKTFLYISSEKRIEGCCIAESISEGFPVIPGSQSESPSPQKNPGQRPWYCSDQPKPAVVGISKIWVYTQSRKQGIASRLLECVRQWFEYGTVIPKNNVAFSDPTPDGKKLAEKYLETPRFLVYKFQ